jgi:FkbM family methyltransferase
VDVHKARKLLRLLPQRGFRRGLRRGVAAAVEHREVGFRREFATILDVGAHTGQFALFARERFPASSIHCFEPLEEARAQLWNIVETDPEMEIQPLALGADATRAPLHVTAKTDSSSLLPVGPQQMAAFPGTREVRTVDVPVRTLDSWAGEHPLDRPTLLKIDVQGFELDVLRGALSTLARVDEILVEASFVELYVGQPLAGEVISFLVQREFRLRGVHSVSRDGSGFALQADFHFEQAAAP